MSAKNRMDLSRVAVIVPTWNAESLMDRFADPLLQQGIRPDQVLMVDSESKDGTVAKAQSFGFRVHKIRQKEFTHGGTRALAASLVPSAEILIYLTQDAILAAQDSIDTLVRAFADPNVGAAYGRQLPHHDADLFAQHACAFNYPDKALARDYESRNALGFKAIFFSDAFGAYRRVALEAVGNFPPWVIALEDTYVAAKMMLQGWRTAYVSEAAVYHSHNLTLAQVFRRYFDTGVAHERDPWMRKEYGEPSGEGIRFVKSEIAFVGKEHPLLVSKVFVRAAVKYLGYQCGKREAIFSNDLKARMSNLRYYWVQ